VAHLLEVRVRKQVRDDVLDTAVEIVDAQRIAAIRDQALAKL